MRISAKRKKSFRISKLWGSLSSKQRKIGRINNRIGSMGKISGMRPSVFRKFMKYMQQLATLRQKERRIIGRIDSIEQKHRRMRKAHSLKAAHSKRYREEMRQMAVRKAKRNYGRWWWVFVLFLLLSSSKSSFKPRSYRLKPSMR